MTILAHPSLAYGPFISRKESMRQGLKYYYVGHVCKRGHFSEHRINGGCFQCIRISYNYQGVRSTNGHCPIKLEAKRLRHLQRLKEKRSTAAAKQHRNAIERNRYARLTADKRIPAVLRSRISEAIKYAGAVKAAKTRDLVGCTVAQLRQHLQAQFTNGMSWENYGKHGWHIDHIRPCASFDLADPEQQRQCFHYSNLQPLWAVDNMRKGARWQNAE